VIMDRLVPRVWPHAWPIMYQTWGKLLFLHWRVPESVLRAHVPSALPIDTFDGSAWIGVTPFTMWNVRPAFVPPIPLASSSHELNVRTYVTLDGQPGVWFFSLDANSALAVWGAWLAFSLPYHRARMHLEEAGGAIHFRSQRSEPGSRQALLEIQWSRGERLPLSSVGSLEFFLMERYCLYTQNAGRLYRCRIQHRPWPLCRARLDRLHSTMIEANGIAAPDGEPLVHAQAEAIQVGVHPLEEIGGATDLGPPRLGAWSRRWNRIG